jgi:hypothetical protein
MLNHRSLFRVREDRGHGKAGATRREFAGKKRSTKKFSHEADVGVKWEVDPQVRCPATP